MATYPHLPGLRIDEIDRAMQHIAQALHSMEAEFLFGAGMSADSGVPQGRQLSRRLLDQFFPPTSTNRPTDAELDALTDQFPFEALVQGVEHGLNGRIHLTAVLKALLLSTAHSCSDAHSLFHQLCYWDGSPRVRRVFTTNFDDLLERKFDAGAEPVSEENIHRIRAIQDSGKIPIIHLHGLLTGSYQITEKDVLEDRFRIVANDFRAALISADAFVFVGYSMNDPDFRRIYQLYREDIAIRDDAAKKTYVVMPATPAAYRFGSALWETRGATWIPLSAKEFFTNLRDVLSGYVEDAVREEICRKYSLSDRAAYDSLVSRTAEALHIETSDAIQLLAEARPRAGV